MEAPKKSMKENKVVKVDGLDAKMLRRLLYNGRVSFDELAQECGTDKNRVWKRYDALERKGVIAGATIQKNYGLFGYDGIATLLLRVDFQQIEQALQSIKETTEVTMFRQYNSVYNFRVIARLRNLSELDRIKELIRRKLPTTGVKAYLWTNVRTIPENLRLIKEKSENQIVTAKNPVASSGNFEYDNYDLEIVKKLSENGRESFREIAKNIGLSTHTVISRYERMLHQGAIKVSIQVNPKKLGYKALIDFNVAFTSLRDCSSNIVDALAEIPDVVIITKTSGDFDLHVTALVRDLRQVFTIQDHMAKIEGITQIEASARRVPEKWPSTQMYMSTM
ncbi:MAG: Lrp/AsnC family transcriptional regulator [Candidatus Bathyarchaeota archaeon]|nr:Lrp/AsnC family transcriptional regulator [Candidatus Bathyarchaeota archaeon]